MCIHCISSNLILNFIFIQPPKVRQRFTLKPKTPHIVCMRSIPGIMEQSRDFANSSIHTHKTDWVSASLFTGPSSSSSPSHLVQRRLSGGGSRLRPKSASFTAPSENGGFMLASTPDLSSTSSYSEQAVPVDIDLFSATSPGLFCTYICICIHICVGKRFAGGPQFQKIL